MTSNIASQFITDLAEKGGEEWEIEAQLKDALKQHFRPEFLNRVDEVIVFHQLTKKDLRGIVDIQFQQLSSRLAERKITAELTEEGKKLLAELGWDPTFGARPLKRVIQQKLENPLATKLLDGEITEGEHITIDAVGKSFAFRATGPAKAKPRSDGRPAKRTTVPPNGGSGDVVEGEVVE
jgi:ATP-dependent Clp protease ATP-binding subunit ClpB